MSLTQNRPTAANPLDLQFSKVSQPVDRAHQSTFSYLSVFANLQHFAKNKQNKTKQNKNATKVFRYKAIL